MQIADQSFVTMNYQLSLETGEEVESSLPGEPMGFVIGAGQVIPGLEQGLTGMEAGERKRIVVQPADGYGPHRPELLMELPRRNFPPDLALKPGTVLQGRGPHGPVTLLVREVQAESVIVDLNHPLAGQVLRFDVEVTEVREATAEELEAAAGCDDQDCDDHGCDDHGCGGCHGGCH